MSSSRRPSSSSQVYSSSNISFGQTQNLSAATPDESIISNYFYLGVAAPCKQSQCKTRAGGQPCSRKRWWFPRNPASASPDLAQRLSFYAAWHCTLIIESPRGHRMQMHANGGQFAKNNNLPSLVALLGLSSDRLNMIANTDKLLVWFLGISWRWSIRPTVPGVMQREHGEVRGPGYGVN